MEETTKEKMNKAFLDMKSRLEEWEMQLKLGQSDATDFFHKKKDEYKQQLNEMKSKISQLDDIGEEKLKTLKAKIEELNVKLNLGKSDLEDRMSKETDAIEKTIQELVAEFKSLKEKASAKSKELLGEYQTMSEDFRNKFETYKLTANQKASEAKEIFQQKKTEVEAKITELKAKYLDGEGKLGDKWNELSGELNEAVDHIRSGFKKFFNPKA